MNIKSKSIWTLAVTSLISFYSQGQGAWTREKGKGFFKLSETVIVSDDFYTPEGTIQEIKTAGVFISSIYGEFGLTDKLTAVAYVPFFFRNTINEQNFSISTNTEPGDESNSFGDFNVGVQYSLLKKGSFVLSSSLLFGVPSGETNGGTSGILQSGDGEFNQLLRIHGGYSFYPAPFYTAAYVGVNNRTKDFSDEFHFGIEAGTVIKESLFLALKLGMIESFRNGEAASSQTGIFSNNLEFISFGPEIAYFAKNGLGVSGSVFGAFSGQNILASPSFSIGITYELK